MSDASNTEQLADTVFQAVKVYVQRHTATAVEAATKPLLERIAVAEKAIAQAPKPLSAAEIEAEVERQVKAIEIVVPPVEPGPKGDPGEPGAAGKDAVIDPALVAAEVTKQISEIEIVVPDPIPGAKGADGKDGTDAVVDYAAIEAKVAALVKAQTEIIAKEFSDMIAETIPTTIKSAVDSIPKPTNGIDGRDGRDAEGRPGKDAADIVPLPMINEERAYPAGTWARHMGGLWLSARDTDPIGKGSAADAGWRVVVDGPAKLDDIELDLNEDGRTIVLSFQTSTGRVERSLTVPWPVDTGVWSAERAYAKGDGATYGGSWWIARAETKDRPGTSQAWRLAVKAGRDGKDMRPDGTIQRVPVRLGN